MKLECSVEELKLLMKNFTLKKEEPAQAKCTDSSKISTKDVIHGILNSD